MPVKPPAFRPSSLPPSADRARGYERERGSARQRGYDATWDKAAKRYRIAHPLCLGCEAMGVVEPATVVDHIEPHEGNQAKLWDEANWQSSCRWHHSAVKQRLEQLWREGLVTLDELRLDSPKAVEVSHETPRRPAYTGIDGWPQG